MERAGNLTLTVPWYQETRHECSLDRDGKERGTMLHRERQSRKIFGATYTKLLIMVISVGWDYKDVHFLCSIIQSHLNF